MKKILLLMFLVLICSSVSWAITPGDISGDDKIGLEEAIHALKVTAGLLTPLPVVDNTDGALPEDVLFGKTYWSIREGDWGLQTGTAPGTASCTGNANATEVLDGVEFSNASASGLTGSMNNIGAVTLAPGAVEVAITEGYHNGDGVVAGDVELVAANIRSGKAIFGVTGSFTDLPMCNDIDSTIFDDCMMNQYNYIGCIEDAGDCMNISGGAMDALAQAGLCQP